MRQHFGRLNWCNENRLPWFSGSNAKTKIEKKKKKKGSVFKEYFVEYAFRACVHKYVCAWFSSLRACARARVCVCVCCLALKHKCQFTVCMRKWKKKMNRGVRDVLVHAGHVGHWVLFFIKPHTNKLIDLEKIDNTYFQGMATFFSSVSSLSFIFLSPLSLSAIAFVSSISLLPFCGKQHKITHKGWRVVKS